MPNIYPKLFYLLLIFYVKLIYGSDYKCANDSRTITINININDGTCDHQSDLQESNAQSLASWCSLNYAKSNNIPCEPDPCLHGSVCQSTKDQTDFQCINCPFPMGGKTCADLACNTTCFRLNQTVYFLYLDQPMAWATAYKKCEENNMTLALLKYRSIRHFLRVHLINLYGYADDTKYQNKFWIGLNRTSHNRQWRWIDGTQLGRNNEWFDMMLRDENCAILNIERYFKIEQTQCNNTQIYALCQQNYTFLTLN
ncbi:hypothetical protein CHUAL_007582 [Chamberlinius hualienensis]